MNVICTLALAAATGAIVLVADAAQAQVLPWCGITNDDGNTECVYYTEQECLQTMSGVGGVCVRNPARSSQQSVQPPPPSSENAQGLLPLQLQDPGPPPN